MLLIITLYNKKIYISSVINALAKKEDLIKEYIFIDDGSTDHSVLTLKTIKAKLPGKVKVIKRANMGASYSTNEAMLMAKGYWVRLLDGDDIIEYKSTAKMLRLAKQKEEFVYGLIHERSVKI